MAARYAPDASSSRSGAWITVGFHKSLPSLDHTVKEREEPAVTRDFPDASPSREGGVPAKGDFRSRVGPVCCCAAAALKNARAEIRRAKATKPPLRIFFSNLWPIFWLLSQVRGEQEASHTRKSIESPG